MQKLLLLTLLAITLGGCPAGTTINGATVVAGIQSACGIVVPIADVSALVAANPALTTVDAIVHAICNAFKAQQASQPTAPASGTPGTVVVNGVTIHYTVK